MLISTPFARMEHLHDPKTVMDAKQDFRDVLDDRMETMLRVHPNRSEDSLVDANIVNCTAEQVVDLRNAVSEGLWDYSHHQHQNHADLVAALNHAVATTVGYWRAVVDTPNCPSMEPEVQGRVSERLECFIEELQRTVRASVPSGDYGLQEVAWDGLKWVVRSEF